MSDKAKDLLRPIGIPAHVERLLGDRLAPEAWGATDADGRWLLRCAVRLGTDRATIAAILADVVPKAPLSGTTEELRRRAVRLLRKCGGRMDGDRRRGLYAQYAALMAVVHADEREAGGYAHAAVAYKGADLAAVAERVRQSVPWQDVQALIDGGALERLQARADAEGDDG